MKGIVFVAFLLAAVNALSPLVSLQQQFVDFSLQYAKNYASVEETMKRFAIFSENVREIELHNSQNHTWTKGINQFTDLTGEEFLALVTSTLSDAAAQPTEDDTMRILPLIDIDWRKQGAVTPVKNQGAMAAAAVFGTVCTLESYRKIKGGPLQSIDEKLVGDKVGPQATPKQIYQYVIDHPDLIPGLKINGFKTGSNEGDLLTGVTANPTSVGVSVSTAWQSYKSGTFQGACAGSINHVVAVVGATDEYWAVKNSWGASWGSQGYIYMARGKNLCSIGNQPAWPV